MIEILVSAASVAVTALIGWLVYIVAENRQNVDAASNLFHQSRTLSDDYKDAYEDLKQDMTGLRDEIEGLRGEVQALIREGERWRGVAVLAVREHQTRTGAVPLWWPKEEPLPSGSVD